MTMQRMTESEPAQVYTLDRRGPNDPRFGSIHVVLGGLVTTLVIGLVLIL